MSSGNKPALIEKVQNREGKVIFRRDTRVCRKCQSSNNKTYIRPLLFPEGDTIVDKKHAFQILTSWILSLH